MHVVHQIEFTLQALSDGEAFLRVYASRPCALAPMFFLRHKSGHFVTSRSCGSTCLIFGPYVPRGVPNLHKKFQQFWRASRAVIALEMFTEQNNAWDKV
jgi:hypothetical protein